MARWRETELGSGSGSGSGSDTAGTHGASAQARPRGLSLVQRDQSVLDLPLRDLLAADLHQQVIALEALTAAVTARSPAEHADRHDAAALADLNARVRRCAQRWEAQRLGWLCAVEADGRWALTTVRTFPHWVAQAQDCAITTARREVRLAHTLRDHLPATAESLRAGTVGSDHARALAEIATTSPARCQALSDPISSPTGAAPTPLITGEQHLLSLARSYPAGAFRSIVRHCAAVTDPEADERGFADCAAREYLDLSQTLDGYHVAGFLTTEHGQVVAGALRAVMGVPAADDDRSPGRRRAQGLTDACRMVLDQGLAGAGSAVRPHLSVHVSWTELQELFAQTGADQDPVTGRRVDLAARLATPPSRWEDGTGPLPRAVLQRLACDSEVTRIVFGPDSQVLNVGRRERTFTGQRRRAVVARDGGCTWPGCESPPQLCEVHHAVTHWADGGETSTDNGALLCWYHHDHVDARGITMAWDDGRWRFRRRDGTPVLERPPPPGVG